MVLILLLYMLFASTFTIGKSALLYVTPFFLIGVRMIVGGALLLGYQYWYNRTYWRFERRDWYSFFFIMLFHIYIPFMSEFWALQYVVSAKACLLFNLSPIVTALLSHYLAKSPITSKQWLGLIIGFLGLLPLLYVQTPLEEIWGQFAFLSLPEIMLLVAVISSSYAWLIVRYLVAERRYSPTMVNGIGMFGGGLGALCTSLLVEGYPHLSSTAHASFIQIHFNHYIQQIIPAAYIPLAMFIVHVGLLVMIANVVCYNLYAHLLTRYSPTLIAFAGFTTPLFALIFGWLILSEPITGSFFVTIALIGVGLYLFYQDESYK